MAFIARSLTLLLALNVGGAVAVVVCQSTPPADTKRPMPPTRDPHTPGYVKAKELPDDDVPPPNVDGNFILGPTHNASPEAAPAAQPNGRVIEFTMSSSESKIYPGIAREPGTF